MNAPITLDDGALSSGDTLPVDSTGLILPELVLGLDLNLLAPSNGVVANRHQTSSGRYETESPMDHIAGQIPPSARSGWHRHGSERVLQDRGATTSHPEMRGVCL